jgi:hypothetical protein
MIQTCEAAFQVTWMHMHLKRSYDTYNHTEHVIARPQPDWYHTIGIHSLVDYVL